MYRTQEEINEDYTTVSSLEKGKVYEFIVASVDGTFATESDPREIDLPLEGTSEYYSTVTLIISSNRCVCCGDSTF